MGPVRVMTLSGMAETDAAGASVSDVSCAYSDLIIGSICLPNAATVTNSIFILCSIYVEQKEEMARERERG